MKIVIPKRYTAITPADFPIFLAGPVLGGGDWQKVFIEHFMNFSVKTWSDSYREAVLPLITFIVPCRWNEGHALASYFDQVFTSGATLSGLQASQTAWEVDHLQRILERDGIIAFGLFPESKEFPRNDGLPYAGDTRGELGRWTTLAMCFNSNSVLIGAHLEFLGINVIRKNLELSWEPELLLRNWRDVYTPESFADWIASEIEKRI